MKISSWQPPNHYSQRPEGNWSRYDVARNLKNLRNSKDKRMLLIHHGYKWELGMGYCCIWRLDP